MSDPDILTTMPMRRTRPAAPATSDFVAIALQHAAESSRSLDRFFTVSWMQTP